MKFSSSIALCAAAGVGALVVPEKEKRSDVNLLLDINQISRSWGQISTYADNPEDYFGVDSVGLPDGCQIVRIF